MPIKIFAIPAMHGEMAENDLNVFLRSHRVLSMSRQLVDQGGASFWTFCVDYLERAPAGGSTPINNTRTRVDYRQILPPDKFEIFSRLRDLRKEISQQAGVPAYMVFTNEQLAKIVEIRPTTKAALEQIAGVGDGRVEKYGATFLEWLKSHGATDATTDGKPVPTDP